MPEQRRNVAVVQAGAGIGLGALAVWSIVRRLRAADVVGQVVLITGGSRGLGFVLAQEFARQGASVVICARDRRELERARQQLDAMGAIARTMVCDVTDRAEVERMVAQVTADFGRIDVLVNNAGIISVGPIQALSLEDFQRAMDTMYWGVVYPTLAVLPQMLARHGGRIVNITSIGGKVSVPHLLPYGSAKFAAVGFSEGLRAEMAREGISVTTVCPGLMRTGSPVNVLVKGRHEAEYTWFALGDSLPLSAISARRAARQIVAAARRGQSELIISWQAQLLARFHGLFPGVTADILGVVNRFLPHASGTPEERQARRGAESETPITRSFLTALTQHAADEHNEWAAWTESQWHGDERRTQEPGEVPSPS